jgi:acyl-CoA thioesterase II
VNIIDGYAADLATALDLEVLDRDLFRGLNTIGARVRPSLYGGQVAAQALVAAGRTVPEGRNPHSLHGYFLRAGKPSQPVIFMVARDRDGRSFSARHVSAVQDGEVIFSMLASFQEGESEPLVDDTPKITPPMPEDLPPRAIEPLIEVREVTPTEFGDGIVTRFSDCMWLRALPPLPDDPLTRAAALTYLSDHGTGFGQKIQALGSTGGPSLDHALWFHELIPADDWVLLHLWPTKAVRTRGMYNGALRDRSGRLGATIAQEHLLGRWPV